MYTTHLYIIIYLCNYNLYVNNKYTAYSIYRMMPNLQEEMYKIDFIS